MHARLQPVEHRFTYPVYFFAFDIDDLEKLTARILFFSYNRWNLLSLHDADYLDRGPGTLRKKLLRYLSQEGCAEDISRIVLITSARFLGHAFNPVSFFYCYRPDGEIRCIVAQVSNTFDESHLYILKNPTSLPAAAHQTYRAPKQFHVSPFFDRSGEYEFRFSRASDPIDIWVNLYREGRPALISQLQGHAKPITAGNLLQTLLRFPFSILFTLPRIHFQAAKLYFQKKLPAYTKPKPAHPLTIRTARPKWLEKLSESFLLKYLSRLQKGSLTLTLPDGSKKILRGSLPGHAAALHIHHYRFFGRLAKDAGIGLGESFMDEDWTSPNVTGFLNFLIENKPYFEQRTSPLESFGSFLNRLRHLGRRNTKSNSRSNIRDHYDLGNEFFKLFLDTTMTYSCGIYYDPSDSPEQAQRNKLDRILQKARVSAGCHVLEIGCGWGSFAIEAVKKTGCRVTGISLSQEQLAYGRQKVREAGLQDQIELRYCDYRDMTGQFDRIVSIEMLEAVGHEFLGTFFEACERLLKPEGVAVIQVITIPDQRYASYRRGADFIQKHIFPGGHLPSLHALNEQILRRSSLFVEDLENIGHHYALTLKAWHRRFLENRPAMRQLGFTEQRLRAWEYYFCYCEAGFAKRYLNDLQLVLTRPVNATLNQKGVPVHAAGRRNEAYSTR